MLATPWVGSRCPELPQFTLVPSPIYPLTAAYRSPSMHRLRQTDGETPMGSSSNHQVASLSPIDIAPRFHAALLPLLEAYKYARELERCIWDFALEIRVLRAAGLTHSDLRWLVC